MFTDVHSISKPKGELFIRSNLTFVDSSDTRVLLRAKFPTPKEEDKYVLTFRSRFQLWSEEMPARLSPFPLQSQVKGSPKQ